jgi:hypothetical protein
MPVAGCQAGPSVGPVWAANCASCWFVRSMNIRGQRIFGSTNGWVDEYSGSTNIRVDKCLGRWMFGLIKFCHILRSTNVWVDELLVDEFLGQQVFGLTSFWVDKFLGRRVFGSTNFWVDEFLLYPFCPFFPLMIKQQKVPRLFYSLFLQLNVFQAFSHFLLGMCRFSIHVFFPPCIILFKVSFFLFQGSMKRFFKTLSMKNWRWSIWRFWHKRMLFTPKMDHNMDFFLSLKNYHPMHTLKGFDLKTHSLLDGRRRRYQHVEPHK